MACVFCEIVAGRRDAEVVWRSEHVIAFRPLGKTRSRILVVPHKHVALVSDCPPDILALWSESWATVARSLGALSFRVHVNQGPPYQAVPHLHAHLLLPGSSR